MVMARDTSEAWTLGRVPTPSVFHGRIADPLHDMDRLGHTVGIEFSLNEPACLQSPSMYRGALAGGLAADQRQARVSRRRPTPLRSRTRSAAKWLARRGGHGAARAGPRRARRSDAAARFFEGGTALRAPGNGVPDELSVRGTWVISTGHHVDPNVEHEDCDAIEAATRSAAPVVECGHGSTVTRSSRCSAAASSRWISRRKTLDLTQLSDGAPCRHCDESGWWGLLGVGSRP